jgi:DNA polymerase III delta subunit
VTVLQADTLLAPKRESDAATRALDVLEALITQPEAQTTLVLVAGSVDKRSRIYRLLLKHATTVECGVIEDQADAERWVRTRVASHGAAIEPLAARLIAQRAGTDVKRLRGDVERLLLYALGERAITVADVRELVGPAALQDDWAMTNAIEAGDAGDALRQLALMLDAGAPAEKILGQLGWLVRSRFPVLTADELTGAVEAVFRTDLDLKRSAGDPRVLLERLVVELCVGKRRGGSSRAEYHGRR